MQDPSFFL